MNKSQKRMQEHDTKTIDTVVRILEKGYDTVLTNIPYWVYDEEGEEIHDTHGELDIIAIRDKYMHVYEIKGRDSKTGLRKACYQLCEFERHLYNTVNLKNIIPEDVVLKKIYVAFNKQNEYRCVRLRPNND